MEWLDKLLRRLLKIKDLTPNYDSHICVGCGKNINQSIINDYCIEICSDDCLETIEFNY